MRFIIDKPGQIGKSSQIKQAYRKLARKYHPDISKSKQAQEKMKEINEAYSILSGKHT